MTTAAIFHSLFFFFFFMVASLTPESAAQSRNNGLSVEIISVDSPSSPFYNPSATVSSRVRQAAERSLARYQHLLSSMTAVAPNDIQAPVQSTVDLSDYMMKLSFGSTGSEVFALIDSGSDVIWTQCIPCDNCYPQSTPMFDPAKSSSYTNLGCSSSFCQDLPSSCNAGSCQWTGKYQDGTSITGALANDTMSLDTSDGNSFSFPVVFGCVHDITSTTISYSRAGGLVGLGRGPLSLLSQLGSVAIGKFSYCFTDKTNITSKSVMNFGNRAIVSGDGLVKTPITTVPGRESFYYLTLDDISVGSQKLNIPPGTFHVSSDGLGGLIIDSGTTNTFLHQVGYDMLLTALKSAINFPVAAQAVSPYQLCYSALYNDIVSSFPDVTFHFLGGDVIVGAWNIFVEVVGFACLAVFPVSSGFSIYGNTVQQDFHVGYDIVSKTVSFAHADCTRI